MAKPSTRSTASRGAPGADTALSWAAFGIAIVALGFTLHPIHVSSSISLTLVAAGGLALLVGCRIALRPVSSNPPRTSSRTFRCPLAVHCSRESEPYREPPPMHNGLSVSLSARAAWSPPAATRLASPYPRSPPPKRVEISERLQQTDRARVLSPGVILPICASQRRLMSEAEAGMSAQWCFANTYRPLPTRTSRRDEPVALEARAVLIEDHATGSPSNTSTAA